MPPTATRPSPLRVVVAADAPPQILIYGTIGPDWYGEGVTAKQIMRELDELSGSPEINVRINSAGGDVFEAVTIYNALMRSPAKIIVDIDALAASAASYIAMAGEEIRIAANAMMMIHRAWTFALGNAVELAKIVLLLQKIDGTLADTYAARSGQPLAAVVPMLDAETWLTAAEAVELGFADSIGQELQVAPAAMLWSGFKNMPQRYKEADATEERAHQSAKDDARLARLRAFVARTKGSIGK